MTDITETVREELHRLTHGKPTPKHRTAWAMAVVFICIAVAILAWLTARVPTTPIPNDR